MVSSAYGWIRVLLTARGMSFTILEKSFRPRIEPCGTPDGMCWHLVVCSDSSQQLLYLKPNQNYFINHRGEIPVCHKNSWNNLRWCWGRRRRRQRSQIKDKDKWRSWRRQRRWWSQRRQRRRRRKIKTKTNKEEENYDCFAWVNTFTPTCLHCCASHYKVGKCVRGTFLRLLGLVCKTGM